MVDFWGIYCKVAYKKYDYFYRNIYGMYLQDLKCQTGLLLNCNYCSYRQIKKNCQNVV